MTIDDLEKCISCAIALARARGVHNIDMTRDYYWNVASPEWTDMTQQPELTVGSLEDDVSELERLSSEPERVSSVDLDRIAAVLRLMSDQLSI